MTLCVHDETCFEETLCLLFHLQLCCSLLHQLATCSTCRLRNSSASTALWATAERYKMHGAAQRSAAVVSEGTAERSGVISKPGCMLLGQ